ncbi:Arm DNA-binding domain-containing protein [Runella sp.]|uniref:Arm DNA-binding domain-containing protein n=1 Tax=Runella sp. TaxID=1960881 RepID=UPI003D14698C
MTIRFWLRTNCVHPEATNAPLYCHIRINGVHTNDFSVDLSIPIEFWNAKSQEVNLAHPLAEQLNTAILNEKRKLLRLKEEMEEKQQYVSASILKSKYITYKKQRLQLAKEANAKKSNEPTFFKIMEEFIKKKRKIKHLILPKITTPGKTTGKHFS